MKLPKILFLACAGMLAFAANSLLARMALTQTAIDPASFSVIRLVSGAAFLLLFVALRYRRLPVEAGSWWSALALFVYAVAFSYAYVRLSTGAGALILFGAVQGTMLCYGFVKGDRLGPVQLGGFLLACFGVAWLLLPGADAPSLSGFGLMAVAGIAWGAYSLRAGVSDPVLTSAGNFARTVPMCLLLIAGALQTLDVDSAGVVYALVSGIVTSGIGYIIWYAVLPHISVVNASTIQLSVPALAALMGVLVLGEPVSLRLLVATVAILLGVAIVLRAKRSSGRPAVRPRDTH